jgi:nicotinamide-nucleotide amidase
MPRVIAGILSTGTEILQGLYADTNAQWLGARLTENGISVRRVVAAPDRADDVADAIDYLTRECEIIIMSGGLGPTEDDLTRQAVCKIFGTKLRDDPKAWDMIVERFRMRGRDVPASNRVQCLIPEGARALYNKWGTAPGFVLNHKVVATGRVVYFVALPGPPRENHPMYEEYLAKEIHERFGQYSRTKIRTLHSFGISESALNETLRPLFEETADSDVTLAFLAGEARVDIRVTVRSDSEEERDRLMREYVGKIRRRLPKGTIFGADAESLELVVNRLLRKQGKTIALAESCTGGLVAKRLTDIPGSSEVFLEGWVVYSNEAKMKRLGVRKSALDKHGAVSPEVAQEMALGALKNSGADLAIAVTGIAGPGGGSAEKPVGLVWYGVAWKERPVMQSKSAERGAGAGRATTKSPLYGVACCRTCFTSVRELVRTFAAHRALDLARRKLLDLPLEISR